MIAFKELDKIEPGAALDSLKKSQLMDVQRALAFLCYPVGVIDGMFGPRTRNAWAEFKDDIGEGNPTILSANSIEVLQEKLGALNALVNTALANTNHSAHFAFRWESALSHRLLTCWRPQSGKQNIHSNR